MEGVEEPRWEDNHNTLRATTMLCRMTTEMKMIWMITECIMLRRILIQWTHNSMLATTLQVQCSKAKRWQQWEVWELHQLVRLVVFHSMDNRANKSVEVALLMEELVEVPVVL